jgi:hypothetical protein
MSDLKLKFAFWNYDRTQALMAPLRSTASMPLSTAPALSRRSSSA